MTLPVYPNSISLSQVNTELGLSATAPISMGSSSVRTLFARASGAISMSDGHGKANKFKVTISSNMSDLDLRSWLVALGWDQTVAVEVTNNASIYASSTGTYGLYVTGSFPGGLTFTNNGNIVGRGGRGDGSRVYFNTNCNALNSIALATAGGPAMYVSTYCTIYNNSIIGGGGGGGGSGGASYRFMPPQSCAMPPTMAYSAGGPGGGGAGNGAGGGFNSWMSGMTAGGTTGFCQGAGPKWASYDGSGGGMTSAGSAGAAAPTAEHPCGSFHTGAAGGSGGSLGASGGSGATGTAGAYSDADARFAGYGRAGGAAIVGNGYITWGATGSRYGAIS